MTMNEERPQQEELEQKITEAELEAQEQDAVDKEESDAPFDAVPDQIEIEDEVPPEKKGLSRARKIWRRILVWLVVIAIAFAGGFFLDTILRYQPEQERSAALQNDLDDRQMEIIDLEAEIDRLTALEEENTALTAENEQVNIHLVLLSARAGVADASLAVEQDRKADARLALNKVGTTLETLRSLLDPDEAEVVDNMIQRYELILVELEDDAVTLQTDLGLLAVKLQTLENTLFAAP